MLTLSGPEVFSYMKLDHHTEEEEEEEEVLVSAFMQNLPFLP